MRKKIGLWIVFLSLCMFLCGCGVTLPDMTDEQFNEVGEYAAIIMLKYDANNRSRLKSMEEVEAADAKKARLEALIQAEKDKKEKEKQEKEEQNKQNNDKDNTGDNSVVKPYDQLEDFFTFPDGIQLIYTGYYTCDSFSDEYLSVQASKQKKLLVLQFALANSTEANYSADIFGLNASYKVEVNKTYKRGILNTLFLNDLALYKGEVHAGSTEDLVLLTEIDPNEVPEIQEITLTIKNREKSCTIQLK